jgi:dolichyl-phosphate beta-glucosyltransferase
MRLFLSVVVPAFNEERRLGPTLKQLQTFLERQPYTSEILVADDGSTDGTLAVAEAALAASPVPLRVLRCTHGGKGHAVRSGMLEAAGEYRFMCDADLAMPVQELEKFLPPRLHGADVAIGSREATGAQRHDEPPYRHMMGRVFNWWVRLLTVRGISDTQCGFKCFTAASAEALFSQQRLKGFGFDVEVLFLAQRGGLRLVEVPIHWYHQQESKVRPLKDGLSMLYDAWRVRWRYTSGGYQLSSVRGAAGGILPAETRPRLGEER